MSQLTEISPITRLIVFFQISLIFLQQSHQSYCRFIKFLRPLRHPELTKDRRYLFLLASTNIAPQMTLISLIWGFIPRKDNNRTAGVHSADVCVSSSCLLQANIDTPNPLEVTNNQKIIIDLLLCTLSYIAIHSFRQNSLRIYQGEKEIQRRMEIISYVVII